MSLKDIWHLAVAVVKEPESNDVILNTIPPLAVGVALAAVFSIAATGSCAIGAPTFVGYGIGLGVAKAALGIWNVSHARNA